MKFKNILKKVLKYVVTPVALIGSIIGLYSINTNAYYLGDDGYLYSSNLLPNSSNFTLVGSDTTFDIDLSTSNYYTFKIYGGNNTGAFAMWTEDVNGNTLETLSRGTSVSSSLTFSPSVNAVKLGIYANNINNANLMLNIGQTSLEYEPYGNVWVNSQDINFFDYLIGNNYFTNGGANLIQTNNGTWYNQLISNANQVNASYIRDMLPYINDKTLLLQPLLRDMIVQSQNFSNFNTSNFTYMALIPSLSISSSSWNFLNIEARYVDITIYAPNFNGSISCIVDYEDPSLNPNVNRVTFNNENGYYYIKFDSNDTRYLYEIDIEIPYNNGWVYPTSLTCNVESTTTWNIYSQAYKDAESKYLSLYNSQKNEIESLKEQVQSEYNRGYYAGIDVGSDSSNSLYGMVTRIL